MIITPTKTLTYPINGSLTSTPLYQSISELRADRINKKLESFNRTVEFNEIDNEHDILDLLILTGLTEQEFYAVCEQNELRILENIAHLYRAISAICNAMSSAGATALQYDIKNPYIHNNRYPIELIKKACSYIGYLHNVVGTTATIYDVDELATERELKKLLSRTTTRKYTPVAGNLTAEQLEVANAISNSKWMVEILFAGAGRGKSFTLASIVKNYKHLVVCPTHASKRVLWELGINANTVHSASYIKKDKDGYPIPVKPEEYVDILVVDEASMFSVDMIRMLLIVVDRFKPNKIIITGDNKQLNPVGRGSLVQLCTTSRDFHTLNHNFRAKSAPDIAHTEVFLTQNHHQMKVLDFVNYIRSIQPSESILTTSDWRSFVDDNLDEILEGKTKILSYKTADVKQVNSYIHNKIGHPINTPFDGALRRVRENNEIEGYFNGDIVRVDMAEDNSISIDGNRIGRVQYIECTEPAYATTIHKSQGATYDSVFIFIPEIGKYVSTNALYTALTRAKDQVCICEFSSKVSTVSNLPKRSLISDLRD